MAPDLCPGRWEGGRCLPETGWWVVEPGREAPDADDIVYRGEAPAATVVASAAASLGSEMVALGPPRALTTDVECLAGRGAASCVGKDEPARPTVIHDALSPEGSMLGGVTIGGGGAAFDVVPMGGMLAPVLKGGAGVDQGHVVPVSGKLPALYGAP
jgi:hypothetical protein